MLQELYSVSSGQVRVILHELLTIGLQWIELIYTCLRYMMGEREWEMGDSEWEMGESMYNQHIIWSNLNSKATCFLKRFAKFWKSTQVYQTNGLYEHPKLYLW